MTVNATNILISESILHQIQEIAGRFPEIQAVSVFGSRAMNTAKSGSDIDLCIFGDQITHDTISLLKFYLLNETTIPVNVDVVHFETLSNAELREHVVQYGVKIV